MKKKNIIIIVVVIIVLMLIPIPTHWKNGIDNLCVIIPINNEKPIIDEIINGN